MSLSQVPEADVGQRLAADQLLVAGWRLIADVPVCAAG
jgi:hypothetical protein